MKKYLIVRQTTDGMGIDQLSVVREYDSRKEAVAGSRDLDNGTYMFMSVLRGEFIVRDSYRVVTKVVDWGKTSQPRKRKAKKDKPEKAIKEKSGTKSFSRTSEEDALHVN